MTPCISQATTLPGSFADDLSAFAAGGCPAVEVWLTKLETHLARSSADDTAKLLADSGVTPAAAAYQGGLLLSQGEQRKAHFDHFKRRLDLCQRLGVPTLVLVADFAQAADPAALQRAVVSLAQAAQWAAGFGVTLALEFRGSDAFCACLDTAVALVEACREPNVGVCLDVFHYYKGPSKPEDLDRLTARNLAHVQVCDVAGVPRELMTDADRVYPGEGDFRLGPVVCRLRQIGYQGYVSLELMNPVLWRSNPTQVAELGMTALRRLLSSSPLPRGERGEKQSRVSTTRPDLQEALLMFDRELTLYAFNLWYGKLLVADVPDEQFTEQPAEGFNHPAWVLGHLAAVADSGLQLLGRPPALPADWHQLFDPGTVPSPERSLYPSKAVLVAAYEAGHGRLAEAVAAGPDPERLARPSPLRDLRPVLPTRGDLLAHILTTHEATHLGQLSAWRRQLGLPSVRG